MYFIRTSINNYNVSIKIKVSLTFLKELSLSFGKVKLLPGRKMKTSYPVPTQSPYIYIYQK